MFCQLCHYKDLTHIFNHPQEGDYYHCPRCDLRFLDPQFYVTKEREKEIYLLHTNSLDNPDYLSFLSPVKDLLTQHVTKSQIGLDYGCGYSPLLATLLQRSEYQTEYYDPLFFADSEKLKKTYDYVISTEVVEHFKNTKKEIEALLSLVKPKGKLLIMTLMYQPKILFSDWHYRRDPTHISFFSQKTWEYLAKVYGLTQIYSDSKRLFIFEKNN